MHILHLIKSSEGADWAFEMIREMTRKYKDITVSVVIPSGGKHFEKYKYVCINVYDMNFGINMGIIKRGIKLRSIVKNERPDIIHSWFTQTTLYARLFLRDMKIPRIFEVVGPYHMEIWLLRFLDLLSSQKNDYWKATAINTYKKYQNTNIDKNRIYFNNIYLDLNTYFKRKNDGTVENLRMRFNISHEVKIIGTASYMYPPKLFSKTGIKNHETLFKVFQNLLKRRNDIVLIVGGKQFGDDNRYEKKLKKIAKAISDENIIFTGYTDNVGRLIKEFDVFVFLSTSENHGGVFESLLFQVPTVSSDRGGIPEIVVDGETGFACSLNSIDNIADKIEILLDNPKLGESFKQKGKQKVLEVFETEKSISKSYEIYQTILSHFNKRKK